MKHLFYILFIVPVFLSCAGKSTKGESASNIITVTIEPLRYFTEAIAGDKFEVISMVPKGSSPETYDPTPQQLMNLGNSVAYFRIGYIGFELVWMDKLAVNAPQMKIYNTSEGIDLIHAEGHFHGDHYHEGGVEPHIWNSCVNASVIIKNILDALVELDPENETYYNERYFILLHEINETDNQIKEVLNSGADTTFMIYHPALSYFARDYGLRQIPIEKDGREPSPAYLKELVDTSRRENVRVIFVQPEFTLRNAELIAQETGAKLVSINPLDYQWSQEMIKTAKALTHE